MASMLQRGDVQVGYLGRGQFFSFYGRIIVFCTPVIYHALTIYQFRLIIADLVGKCHSKSIRPSTAWA